MSTPYTRQEKLAGLFLIAGLLLIFLGAVLVGGGRDWFRTYNSYYALYNEGYGLAPGTKVKFRGTDVGTVTRLELTLNNKVKIHMSILAEFADRITSDSTANINSPTFIGSEYIEIIPGDTKGVSPIPRGGQIPAMERKTLTDYIIDLRLDVMLAKIEAIMANVESLTNQLQDPNGPFIGTLSDVRKITFSMSEGQGTIGQLMVNDSTFKSIDGTMSDINTISGDIAVLSGDLKTELPRAISQLRAILDQLEKASRDAPIITRDVRQGTHKANQVLDSVKRNIFIRGNITPDPEPETRSYPARQDSR